MKTLPKYWAVRKDTNNPIWKTFITWFIEKSGFNEYHWSSYYWYDCSDGYNWYDYLSKIEDFDNPVTLITLKEWDSIVNWTAKTVSKKLTYETQYLRSDWTLFTRDSIDWKSIEDLKQEMKEAMWTVNKIRGLLKAHKNKFSN